MTVSSCLSLFGSVSPLGSILHRDDRLAEPCIAPHIHRVRTEYLVRRPPPGFGFVLPASTSAAAKLPAVPSEAVRPGQYERTVSGSTVTSHATDGLPSCLHGKLTLHGSAVSASGRWAFRQQKCTYARAGERFNSVARNGPLRALP